MLHGKRIAVIGGSVCSKEIYEEAYQLGRLLANQGCIIYNGGKSGVMEAVSRGAREEGGIVVGILPENNEDWMNEYITVPVLTGLGIARNLIIINSAQFVIALDGKYGTLSEIAFALQLKKPVIGIKTWDVDPNILRVKNAQEALEVLQKMAGNE